MSNYIKQLPENARKIEGTMNWVDPLGNIYGIETRMIPNKLHKSIKSKHKHYGEYFKSAKVVNNHNGYVYATIKYIDKNGNHYSKQRRVHILVAETFLENPNSYPIVGHRNNNKTDNRIENLYWTTFQENTQKAVDDGLMINDKGYDDSQSKSVIMFDTYTNAEIGRYGSIREASRNTGIGMNTIARQAKYKKPVRKPFYFRFQDDESAKQPTVVIQYDLLTHKEIGRYYNTFEAERQTGINYKTISEQCKNNKVPKWSKSKTYFLYSR